MRCLLLLLCLSCFAIAAETPVQPVASEKPDDAAIQKLVKDLDDDDFETRIAAYAKLIAIGSPAKAALQAALAEKNCSEEVKFRATVICRIIDLREKLSPKFFETYPAAAEELRQNRQGTFPWLKYFLLISDEKDRRDFPITDLEVLGGDALRELSSADDETIRNVFKTIRESQLRKLIPELLARLQDMNDNESVRGYAAAALGQLGAKEAIPELLARLKDTNDNESVRGYAAAALGQLEAKEAIPELLARFKDVNENLCVRAYAVTALGQLEAKEAIPELQRITQNESSQILLSFVKKALEKLQETPAK